MKENEKKLWFGVTIFGFSKKIKKNSESENSDVSFQKKKNEKKS